ncbi:hypothetical protein ACFVVA_34865 [Kitasatospora sp. NPDC058048]|uniref:hypothetical protein n=1 Tax=Kitasatospora sp. NPDC058048 TaxID=3346313 RepID=UPI0036D915FA
MPDSEQHLVGVEAVIVDWDGTVADNTAARRMALEAALAPHGIAVPTERYRRLAGLPVCEVIAALAADAALPVPVEDVVARSRAALLGAPAPPPPWSTSPTPSTPRCAPCARTSPSRSTTTSAPWPNRPGDCGEGAAVPTVPRHSQLCLSSAACPVPPTCDAHGRAAASVPGEFAVVLDLEAGTSRCCR